MIKKLIMLVLAIAGVYSSVTAFKHGYIGIKSEKFSFVYEVPSYEGIKTAKTNYETKVNELKRVSVTSMGEAKAQVENEKDNYNSKKLKYEALAVSATSDEIAEANKIERYLLDYLWIRIGNYANDNDVKFKLTPETETAVLYFDITGSYISIINFMYDIQNDDELDFNIDDIVIQGGSSDQIVKAKFKVEGVNIVTSPDDQTAEGGDLNV